MTWDDGKPSTYALRAAVAPIVAWWVAVESGRAKADAEAGREHPAIPPDTAMMRYAYGDEVVTAGQLDALVRVFNEEALHAADPNDPR